MIILPTYNDVKVFSDGILFRYHKGIIKPNKIWDIMEICINKAIKQEDYIRYKFNHINYSKTTIPSKIIEVSDTIQEGEYGVFFTITTELINGKFVKRTVLTLFKLTNTNDYTNIVLSDNEIGKPLFFGRKGTIVRYGALLSETQWRILFSLPQRK